MKRIPIKTIFLISLGLCLAGISGCGDSQVSVTISPRNVTIANDQTFPFTVEVSNTQDLAVTWSIAHNTNNSLGFISQDGVYTPPNDIPTPNTVTIRVTSDADSSSTDAVSVTIVSGNTLRFITNLQVTNYSNPPGISCTSNCIATTVSSGQHSVETHHAKHGKYDYTLIYTVWSDNRNGSYDVFFRQITMKALVTNPPSLPITTLSNTIKVNDTNTRSSDSADPSLTIDNAGNVYIAWHTDGGTPGDHDIYVNKGKLSPFRDDTIPNIVFTTPILFSDGLCDKRAPSIAEESNKMHVAWEDNRTLSSCGSNYIIRAAAGPPPPIPPPGSPPPPPTSYPILSSIYTGSGSQTEPSIGVFQNNLHIAWTGAQTSCTGICFAKGTAPTGSGASWSTTAPVLVNDNTGAANHSHPSLAVDTTGGGHNSGNVYVVWQDNRNANYNIFFAKKEKDGDNFDAATDPNNPNIHNIRVNDDTVANGFQDTADHQHPSIVVERSEPNARGNTPNKIYVVWDDTRSGTRDIIMSKSLDGGNNFRINSGSANLPLGSGPASDPSVAVDAFGRAYLIWTDERNSPGTDVFFAMGQ